MKNRYAAIFVFLGVIWYSVGATIHYYFYSDDYSILYYIQRNRLVGWPYDWEILTVFKPLYLMFNIHPQGYFVFGVLTYMLAAVFVGAFFYILTKRASIAYVSALIFATGYIGIEQFNMMIVSMTNNLSIVGIVSVLIAYSVWLQSRKVRYYILSLCLFFLSLLLFPFRTYVLILFVPTLEVLYGGHILKSILSLLPFYLMGKYSGVFGYGGNGRFGMNTIIEYTRPAMLKEYIADFGRMILPNQTITQVNSTVGLLMMVIVILLSVILWRKKPTHAIYRHLLFALALTLEGYVGFFFLQPSFMTYGPTNRYLPITFIGLSLLFPIIFWSLGILFQCEKHIRWRVFCFILVLCYIGLLAKASRRYVSTRVQEQGLPGATFISQLKKYIPVFPERATILIDAAEYYPSIPRLGNILSNAIFPPEVTFAVMYDVPIERVTFTSSNDEYVKRLKQSIHPEEKFYSFFYDGVNLQDTTKEIALSLQPQDARIVAEHLPLRVIADTKDPLMIPVAGIPSYGELQLELTLKISPLDPGQFTYPYYFGNPTETQKKEIFRTFNQKRFDRRAVFSYLIDRAEYYKTVKATGTESNYVYPLKFLVDNRVDTWWTDAENLWQLKPKYEQYFVIDLGSVKQINRIQWIPVMNREANVYTVSLSSDAVNWHAADIQSSRQTNGDMTFVSDAFPPTSARYIKYMIKQTRNGWTPGIREIEVIESDYSSIDPLLAWRMGTAPFEYIRNQGELMQSYDYVTYHGMARILTKTNKEDSLDNKNYIVLPFFVDGQTHTYTMSFPSRGTTLEMIAIQVAYPAEVSVEQVRIL